MRDLPFSFVGLVGSHNKGKLVMVGSILEQKNEE